MSASLSSLAGKPAPATLLVDVPKLIAAYYSVRPDPSVRAQRVGFGTSGHRGTSFDGSFNEAHVLAISQAICSYRAQQNITGPLFIGFDTHALSRPAFDTALEVLAANEVVSMIAADDEFTPTPAISHAILVYNRGRTSGLADGIVITPSHNPPESGGFKYNPPNGGPADTQITSWIENEANRLLEAGLNGVKRMPLATARAASHVHQHHFIDHYISELGQVIDMDAIRSAKIHMGVDPLGGAGVHYWARIADRYQLDLTVVNKAVDPTFGFMTVDWDGRIRMDPSSSYAMQRLIALKDSYDVAFACDPDHDRHGIVTATAGLLPSNNYLAVAINYLFQHRPHWQSTAGVGKTLVSSSMIDRVASRLGRNLYEVPVGFKWFVDGLFSGTLGFGGEESAGASFNRMDGSVWSTDKDGLIAALLSAEITARTGRDPGEQYRALTAEFGESAADRVDAPADVEQKKKLAKLSPDQVRITELAGEKIERVLDRAPGNNAPLGGIKVMTANGWFAARPSGNQAPIGGLKVVAENGWFAARPSGTENIYKLYAESFRGEPHLRRIIADAQVIVDAALAST